MSVTQSLSVTEQSYSQADNTSVVRIVWLSKQTGLSFNAYTSTAYCYVSLDGVTITKTYTISYTLPQNTTQTILDTTITIPHKDDGTGAVMVKTWMDTGISAGIVEKSQTIALTTILRESTIDSLTCSTQYLTGAFTYQYTPKNPNAYNRMYIYTNVDGTLTEVMWRNRGQKSASRQTATETLNESRLETIYNRYPNTSQVTLRFILRTYSDSSYIKVVGSAYKDITLSIPNDETTQPTVSTMTLSPLSDLTAPYNGLYLQGHSRVKAALGFETKYGASVVASSITVNGNSHASPYESDILTQDGTISVKATVKDSRGFYGTYYKEIEVIPYSKPYIRAKSGESSVIASRCDSSANLTDSGTYLKIKAKVVYSNVQNNNQAFIKFRYRKEGGAYTDWQTILDCKTDNSDEVITPPLLNGALDIKSNYQVQIIATDDLYDSAPITIAVPSDAVYMDRPSGGKSMGLGGYSSGDGNLDVYWKTMARGGLSMLDAKGDEIPLDYTLPNPRDQIKGSWNPNDLECGIYVVSGNCDPLKVGDSTIMANGVLIQMVGSVSGNVKIQIALPVDTNRNPMYRICWYSNWADWRSLKI